MSKNNKNMIPTMDNKSINTNKSKIIKKDEQIINIADESYNDINKKKSVEKMKKKKEENEYKIIREYKNLFSCNELIIRIIRHHIRGEKNQ